MLRKGRILRSLSPSSLTPAIPYNSPHGIGQKIWGLRFTGGGSAAPLFLQNPHHPPIFHQHQTATKPFTGGEALASAPAIALSSRKGQCEGAVLKTARLGASSRMNGIEPPYSDKLHFPKTAALLRAAVFLGFVFNNKIVIGQKSNSPRNVLFVFTPSAARELHSRG
jgi:hypothetical protein